MKKTVLLIASFTLVTLALKSQDLPNPPANLQVLPAGSYVIPMDNTLQSNSTIGSGKFNLKSYGLLVHLLNYNVKIKWVIKAGKIKDAIDFTTTAQMFKPTLEASSTSRNFIGGPFVIFAADTSGVSSLINTFYTNAGLTGHARPKVFKTIASTPNVDIRYDLTGFKPKAAILDDGGNEDIHVDFMQYASIPVMNYSISDGASLQENCYTFASEPHNSKSGPLVDSAIVHIKQFVLSGRNFLAECAAVRTYENSPLGRFQTVNGIDDVNRSIGTNINYHHADLGFYQFQGMFNASGGGSVKNWEPIGGQSTTNFSKATGHGAHSNAQGASVAKLTNSGYGGMVFYLGNHNFGNNNEADINGVRMYMNAFLTPVAPNAFCETNPNNLLPVKLTSFQGYVNDNKVNLNWTVAENEFANQFEVEKSLDGSDFSTAALVFGTDKAGNESYQFAHATTADVIYYRLKMIDNAEKFTYSKVLMFKTTNARAFDLKILNNPVVSDKLTLGFENNQAGQVIVTVRDISGRQVIQHKVTAVKGSNMISLQLPVINNGVYVVDLFNGTLHNTAKFIKQ